jgi:phenylpropionate dioxygenase-like ring-hydroxylating dioxygenase large terminal subunit
MSYLYNTWYAAGWAESVTNQLRGLTILDAPVLLYRDAGGVPHAIGNRCPHRFAPLHLGKLIDDTVECGYHGLRFGADGSCVLNPHGRITPSIRVPSWPLVERYGLLWIWMGDPDRADPDAIVDLRRLVDPKHAVVRGSMEIDANYELLSDNLLDLSHAQFLHADFFRTPGLLTSDHEAGQEGNSVYSRRFVRSIKGPSSLMCFMEDPECLVDHWQRSEWSPPGICRLDNGVTLAGSSEDAGIRRLGVHIVTPATKGTTHYFYAAVRNYRIDDPTADQQSREWHRVGFGEQDKPMIEAVQQMMRDQEFSSLKPVLLATDAAAIRARRILRELIEAENASSEPEKVVASTVGD